MAKSKICHNNEGNYNISGFYTINTVFVLLISSRLCFYNNFIWWKVCVSLKGLLKQQDPKELDIL